MAEARRQQSDTEIEQALVELGTRLAYPETPDLAAAVLRGLTGQPAPRRLFGAPSLPIRRRLALAALALVVLTGLLVLLSPSARSAIAGRLGLRGVRITAVATVPALTPLPTVSGTPAPLGSGLNLGLVVSLSEAQAQVRYRILMPALQELGSPGAIYLDQSPPGGEVSFAYGTSPALPQTPETGVGLLFSQFRGDLGPNLIDKGIGPGTTIEPVTVNGGQGWWIAGAPHFFIIYQDANGQTRGEETRLAGNVLLWEQDGLTLRLESALSKEEALRIAASVR